MRAIKLLAALVVLLSLIQGAEFISERRPERASASYRQPDNVLLVTMDCLRSDHVGPDAASHLTPQIQALAGAGIRCTRAYAQSDTTGSCALAVMTSRYVSQLNAAWSHHRGVPNLAEILKPYGWQTAAFVSWVGLYRRPELEAGFDQYVCPGPFENQGLGLRDGDRTTRLACDWLQQRTPGERWFAWVMYWDLHWPMLHPTGSRQPDMTVTGAALRRDYDECVRYDDACLGSLMAVLKARGLAAHTLVVVTGLHGLFLGGQGKSWRNHAGLYQDILRVPLVLWAPGRLPKGEVIDRPVMHVDVLPTILAALDLPAVPTAGQSLLAALPPRRTIYAESLGLEARAIIQGRWKYMDYPQNLDLPINPRSPPGPRDPSRPGWSIFRPRGLRELYDLGNDPDETTNLLRTHPDRADGLERQLGEWQAANGGKPLPPRPIDAALKEALRKNGYFPSR